ncbi:hypothetical protein [Aquimarina algiphila]|uniref:hypothetical protein n=1 Tax=Aquimarina algiphila TaxID=2047982 RepID=UPI00232C8ECB|nr:hypothetical protein [Aquimarina algiphila]
MRFQFFTSLDVSRFFSSNDINKGINSNSIQGQIKVTSNYSVLFLIGALAFLLCIYSFIAYSFLETSSLLLLNEHDEIQIDTKNVIIYKNSKYTNDISMIYL